MIFSISLISYLYFTLRDVYINEKKLESFENNYTISKLYSSQNEKSLYSNLFPKLGEFEIFCIIEIPSLSLKYPVLNDISEENLKISPCKFYGTNLNENTNICIAGHNYENDLFFSKINTLSINDKIILKDNLDKQYEYVVYDIFEVFKNELSPIYVSDLKNKELTLVTCNNFNNKRIIVKAKTP